MDTQEFKEFNKELRSKGLVISRIPSQVRDDFVQMANSDFCGDYGLLLKFIWDQAKEYQYMKATMFGDVDIKLNHIISLVSDKTEEPKKRRLLSGKEIQ